MTLPKRVCISHRKPAMAGTTEAPVQLRSRTGELVVGILEKGGSSQPQPAAAMASAPLPS